MHLILEVTGKVIVTELSFQKADLLLPLLAMKCDLESPVTLAKELQVGTASIFISGVLANTMYPYIPSVRAKVESG